MDFTLSNNPAQQILKIQENSHPQQKQKCEIKEESIKCEGLENQQPQAAKESQSNPIRNNEEVQIVEIRWFKCEKCLFLGISQQSLDNHSCNESERTKQDCPGCNNSFFSTVSLESHLSEDHKMLKEEMETFMNQLSESSRGKKKKSKPTDKNKEKSRIYIKNVQLLKKPQETPSGKSKIYIKNVQLLRKPTLSQTFPDNLLEGFDGLEDDDLTHFSLFNTTAPENFGTETTEIQTANEFQPQIYVRSMETMNNSQENQEFLDTNGVYQTEPIDTTNYQQDNDRNRSKISIKNISVLKEPNLIHPNIFNSENNQNFPSIHLKSVDELNSTFATTNSSNNNSQQMTTTMASSSTLTTQFLDFSMESHYPNIDYSFMSQTDDNDDTDTIILDNIEIEDSQQLPYSGSQQESLNDLMNFNMPTISSSNYVLKGPEFADEDFLMIPLDNDTNNSQTTSEVAPISNMLMEDQANSTVTAMETVDVSENEISEDHQWSQHEETSESLDNFTITEQRIENSSNPDKIPTIEIQDDDHPKSEQITETSTPTVQLENNAETNQPRIYVASNLMKDPSQQKKGRPRGAKKIIGGSVGEVEKQFRCGFEKCGCRFSSLELMQYHRQCHTKENDHGIVCPECKGNDWKNWNSLHSHLFRVHSIDMGLYKCDKCNFRTPNLSLLNNMHSKIHLDDKNFNCTQCQKAFKNSKQLKNHRRTHRLKEAKQALLEKSEDGLKVVTENGSIICVKCHKRFPNEITLQAHSEIHMKKGDNYECSKCFFVTTDHNSFRRHNLKHADYHPYKCKFCSYTCVQSAPYRKHIEKRHPEEIQNVFFKCMKCKFTTINRTKFEFHQQKHDEKPSIETIQKPVEVMQVLNEVLPPVTTIQDSTINVIDITDSNEVLIIDDNDKVLFPDVNLISIPNQNKIKVKSNLVLTDPNKYVNLSCSGFLHDILPNQISASSSSSFSGTVPNHQPMIRPAMFAKMDNTVVHEQNQQNLEQQDFHPYGSTIDSSWIMNN